MNLQVAPPERDSVPFVVAVTRDIAARAQLARQLSGDSILLLFPDHATAARTFGEGVLRTDLDPVHDPAPPIQYGALVVDQGRQQVTWQGTPLRLTRLEREMLGCLAEPPIRVWSYARLYAAVWRDAYLGDTSTLHAATKRLRRKLRDAGVTAVVESVRGVGFRLTMEPPRVSLAPADAVPIG